MAAVEDGKTVEITVHIQDDGVNLPIPDDDLPWYPGKKPPEDSEDDEG